MKKRLISLLAMTMILSLAACSTETKTTEAPSAAASEISTEASEAAPEGGEVTTVVYGFPGTAARFNYQEVDGTYNGYEIEIVRELDKRLDDVEFELYFTGEFSALTAGLDANKFQMVGSNMTWKEERANNYLYSTVTYFSSPTVIGVREDETEIAELDDLQGRKICAVTGTAQSLFLEAYNEEHADNPILIDYTESSSIDIISLVESGRYDACLFGKVDFNTAYVEKGYLLKTIDIENSEKIQMPDAYFIFRKGDTELQEKVDAVLQEMKDDGTLSKLCVQFFDEDFVK